MMKKILTLGLSAVLCSVGGWAQQVDVAARLGYPRMIVYNGKIVTTAGVSAGIDGALHVVSRLLGEDAARSTARYMEYDKWEPGAGLVLTGEDRSESK